MPNSRPFLRIANTEASDDDQGDEDTTPDRHDSPPVLSGEVVTFTGTLASMTHEQASEQVASHGGQAVLHVSRHTTMLVLGEEGWLLEEDGRPSQKLQQAESLQEQGHPLRIVREADWLRMLDLHVETSDVKRLYTPAMLSQLLHLPVHVIRSWERAGLIRATRKVFRLPYFTYQEVTTARKLSELMQSGASQRELTESLLILQKFLPDNCRVFEQLEMLSNHRRLVIRDQHGLLEPQTRQRLLNFAEVNEPAEDEGPGESGHVLRFVNDEQHPESATDWLVEGCRRAEISDTTEAIRCFRQALRIRPQDAEAHFYLADSLYRLGKQEAALERYLAAVENDAEYLEAWTQIGCLYADMNKWHNSIQAFDEALALVPDFAEAHLHKAETLLQMKQVEDAIPHWKASLKTDARGPWAELAEQRLEQFGCQIAEQAEI